MASNSHNMASRNSIDTLFVAALALVFAGIMLWQYFIQRCWPRPTIASPRPCCCLCDTACCVARRGSSVDDAAANSVLVDDGRQLEDGGVEGDRGGGEEGILF